MKVLQFLIVSLVVTIINCDLLDEINAHIYLFVNGQIGTVLGTLDSPIYNRVVALSHIAIFDALAAYRPTSTGIYAKIPKVPANQITNRNKNIAVSYALYRTHVGLVAAFKPGLDDVFNRLGLDPNDQSLDLNTPVGIGNYAAKVMFERRVNDGMNQLGDANGKKYNRNPYEDYTGYRPRNSAENLRYIGNWQPNIEAHRTAFGEYTIQKHITPQYAITKPIAVNPFLYNSPPPFNSFSLNTIGYKNQADNVLAESFNLNDRKKMIAEHFNNKSMSIAAIAVYLTSQYNRMSIDDTIIIQSLVSFTSFDAGIVAFKEKIKYDAVRPFSSIRYLYGDTKISAWGGVGKGPVTDITGNEWKSYTRTAPESEYPSSATCICSATMRAASIYFNSKNLFGLRLPKPQGSSVIEPGITPAADIALGPYNTVDDYVDECVNARVYSGVHFRTSAEEGKRLCRPIGDVVYDWFKKYI